LRSVTKEGRELLQDNGENAFPRREKQAEKDTSFKQKAIDRNDSLSRREKEASLSREEET